MTTKAKNDEELTWSPERVLFELAQIVRIVVPLSPDNNRRLTEWGKHFAKNHPEVADEIRDEAQKKVEADNKAREEAEQKAKDDAEAARPAPKKNEQDEAGD